MSDIYSNPLISRYASREMAEVFSDEQKFKCWRKLWLALAEGEQQLGLDISDEQIAELKDNMDNLNLDVARAREKEVRHDVMSHVYAYALQCPKAAPIIHLGATSCYVGDNADLICYYTALKLILAKITAVLDKLKTFALKYKAVPTLGFTHLQPAQLVTIGKRATLWMQDLLLDAQKIEYLLDNFKLRGVKGTTGTQASFLQLFDGDYEKVKKLNEFVVNRMGFKRWFAVSGQTYARKYDYEILSVLSGVAQSAYKMSNDVRLLANMKEMEEPFEKQQIGSSAMAYKRNPMRSERISSLARYVISLPVNAAVTASTQWFERTLDDSANRRIVMAEGFLAVDAILEIYANISENFVVYEKVVEKHILAELPFMATETVLMECVKAGGNRQELHEKIRVHSMAAAKVVKEEGGDNDLVERILADDAFKPVHPILKEILSPKNFIGAAEMQTMEFIADEVEPFLQKYPEYVNLKGHVSV